MDHPLDLQSGPIDGPLMIRPRQFGDDRGRFSETWRSSHSKRPRSSVEFVQDNESVSGEGVLRGLHFQVPDRAQGKLVRVVRDPPLMWPWTSARTAPPTDSTRWSCWRRESLAVLGARGFAHGFVTLEPDTVFCYKCTEVYSPEHGAPCAGTKPTSALTGASSIPCSLRRMP